VGEKIAMRILLFGNRGMLGSDLESEFERAGYEVRGVDKEDVDVTQGREISDVFRIIKPEIVVNATGYTDVDGAETNRELAFSLNDQAVKYLSEAAASVAAKFIHFSTEMVFDGKNAAGYTEAAETKPVNVYGASKAAGEKYVVAYTGGGYLVRTSWLYGKSPQRGKPRGMNFIDAMLKLAAEKKVVRVVNDQFGKLTSTSDLAQAVVKLINGGFVPGTYHLVNEGAASWYDIAKEVWRIKKLTVPLLPITSHEYFTSARRSQYGILVNTKFPSLRHWHEALADYLS